MTEVELERLRHELEIHQIELESQNEELRLLVEELDVSRRKYFDLYDLAPVGYFTICGQGIILEANLTVATMLGVARSALVDRPISRFILPEDRGFYDQQQKLRFEAGVGPNWEMRMLRADGSCFWAYAQSALTAQNSDAPATYLVTLAVIDERKQMEKALYASEQKFRTLAENSPNIIIRYDLDLRRVYVNTAYVRETGIPAAFALDAIPCGEWLNGSSIPVDEYKARLRRVLETGVPDEISLEWLQPDTGKVASHIIHAVAEHDPAGQAVGVLAIGNNVSRLMKAEKLLTAEIRIMALVAGEEPLDAILALICLTMEDQVDDALCAVMLADPQGTRLSHGAAPSLPEEYCKKIDGTRIGEGIGSCGTAAHLRSPVIVSDIANDPLWRKSAPLALRHGLRSCWSTPVFAGTGALLGTFSLYCRSTRSPKGDELNHVKRATALVGIAVERTRARKSLQANQRKLSEMAVELSLAEERERRRIAAELHDRIGQTLLLGKMKFDALAKKHRSMAQDGIAEDVRRLLADSINDVRSLTQRLHPPMLAGAGLSGALDWLCTKMRADYGLRVDLVEDKRAKPLTDELRSVVYQSARELLINVAKHAATDHARLDIGRDGQMLKLAVEDRGRGFDILADSIREAGESGFGLFNIRERITYLKGDLTVESTPGQGTCVTLRAPLSTTADE